MTSETRPPERRVITKEKAEIVIPSVDTILNDAMTIISSELAHYRGKVRQGHTLEASEARIVREYVKALVELSKEAREAARSEDLSKLTNEELLQLAMELTKTK